ncbi:MAG: DNA-binding protein AraC-type [Bacillota bacterium]|nr:DNA-binding protein AraC-type [Bacillota bacterium]
MNANRMFHVSGIIPKQPEFVLSTSKYTKKLYMQYGISHFYQFTSEATKMGVIPDACIDILFCKKDGRLESRIAGSRLSKGEVDNDLNCEYFGVRFMPGVNPAKETVALHEIVNSEMNFKDMIPSCNEKDQLLEQLYLADTFEERIGAFMNYYRQHYNDPLEDTHSLKYFLQTEIIKANGDMKISELSALSGYSERYLNKKIHEDFGLNPNHLIRFIRFQKAVGNLTSTLDHLSGVDTALESGYYDQSHFIKDFRKFSGETPMRYIHNLQCHSYGKKLYIID